MEANPKKNDFKKLLKKHNLFLRDFAKKYNLKDHEIYDWTKNARIKALLMKRELENEQK